MLTVPTLRLAAPAVPLRNGTFRTVFDGVWIDQLPVDPSFEPLLAFLRNRPAQSRAGVVNTLFRHMLDASACSALTAICQPVAARLFSTGLLDPQTTDAIEQTAVLMSMRGAQPHFDGQSKAWRNRLFWSLSLEDTDTDVLFGNLAIRVPQTRGTLLIFDGNQPHCLLAREHAIFQKNHFPKSRSQFFVGGDFDVKDWSALGASRHLTPQDLASHLDVLTMRINPKTCAVQADTHALR